MFHKKRLLKFAKQENFQVQYGENKIVLKNVPCLLDNGGNSTCRIEKSFNPKTFMPTIEIGSSPHVVRVLVNGGNDGRVYHADGKPVGNQIDGDGKTRADISIRQGTRENPEDDDSVESVVYRYAKQIVGAVAKKGSQNASYLINNKNTNEELFKIPNTFEDRSGVKFMQDRIREQKVAIIGLGGTGAYLLDLIVKTPVAKIHLCDFDKMNWHNFMRAPGAPTEGEIKYQRQNQFEKVHYYQAKYKHLRLGIKSHIMRANDQAEFTDFLSKNSIEFAFVCIDQSMDSNSPRQDGVYASLSKAKIPFIDSGVSISLENEQVRGAVTTSSYQGGDLGWQQGIPNARVDGDLLGYRNVQLPEVNALAATLAVMEWRRLTGQFDSETKSFMHKFRLEKGIVRWSKKRD